MASPIRRTLLAIGTVAVLATPSFAAPADNVPARIDGYKELGAAFKAVNDGIRTSEVQTILIQVSARQIRSAAASQYNWFPAGSGPQPGVRTAAKADIWDKPTKFQAAQDAFAAQAAVFQRAANSGDIAIIRTEARKLGATCKACHEAFREEEH